MKKAKFQKISVTTEEQNGLLDGGIHVYPVELSLDECKKQYTDQRMVQSVKGFLRPMFTKIVSAEIILVF